MRQEVNNGKTVLGHLSLSPSLSFYPLFLPYILLLFIKNLKGKRLNVEQATQTTEKSFARITPTVFENRTNWHNNSAKWTRTTMDTRGLRNSRKKTQAYGVNDQWRQSLNFQKLLQGTDCKHLQLQFWGSQVQNEHQHFEEHTPVKVSLWKLPIKPGLR